MRGMLWARFWLMLSLLPIATSAVLAAPAASPPITHLRVVADTNYPPYMFVDASGRLQGYEADVWKLFEKHTGIQVEIARMDWKSAQRTMLDGKVDVIDVIYRTPIRDTQYDFSEPYATLPVAIYVDKRITGIHDTQSLIGFPITTEDGDACEEKLIQQGLEPTGGYRDYQSLIKDAADGKVHIFCMDESPANYFLYRADILDKFYRAVVIYEGQLHWAVRKGDAAMLALVQQGMAKITPAERKALREKWLDRPFVITPYLRFIGIGGGIVLGLFALMSLWLWLLRRSVDKRTQELQFTHNKLLTAFNASPDAMWVKDRNGVYLECNQRIFTILGLEPKALLGHDDSQLFPPEVAKAVRAYDQEVMRSGKSHTNPMVVTVDGKERRLDCIHVPLFGQDGTPQGIFGTARDVTDLLKSEEQLRLAAVAFETQVALAILAFDGTTERVNTTFITLTGYTADEVVGIKLSMLKAQEFDAAFYQNIWEKAQKDGHWAGQYWISTKHHQLRLVHAEISGVPDEQGGIGHFVLAMTDLTEEHEAHARANHMAQFDPITDLPNRSSLHEKLGQALADPTLTRGALLLIGIDHFKRVNDLRGHALGDRLLALLGQRLHLLFDDQVVLSRLGGDAFAVLITCNHDSQTSCEDHASSTSERIRQALLEPFWLGNDTSVTITVSIGWTRLHGGENAADQVLKEAELAMYSAKADGRNCVRQFEPAALAALERQEALANDLLNVLSGDTEGLDLYFQLQVNQQDQTLGAEALLRWSRPNGERIPPDVFIPIAEDSGLILPLGDWVLQRACERLASWASQALTRDLVLAINVSAKQFAQPGFVEDVRQALRRSGANAQRLKLEITESMILGDIDTIIQRLAQLRALGITISLDDFGTGYSSLAYLSRLPLDQLKIDKSFIMRLPEDDNDATVAQTVIGMGRGLGLEVIAEGVETQAQRDFLTQHGCHAFQGYFFSRPLPLMEFEVLLYERQSAQPTLTA